MATKAQNLLQKRYKNKKDQELLKYPIDIGSEDSNGNIIIFSVKTTSGSDYQGETTRRVTNSDERVSVGSNPTGSNMTKRNVNIPSTIALFTPANIQTSYASEWNTTELGSLGRILDTVEGLSNINSWSSAKSFWNNQFKSLAAESSKQMFAGMVQALTPFNAKDYYALSSKTIENPYLEVVFNGVQHRTFSFTFKMIPRSPEEQLMIERIIETFKYHRAPGVLVSGSNNYWTFPAYFDIKFYNKGSENEKIFKVKPCAMTNMSVNHSSESSFTTYKDGAPFSTELTLEFTEIEILTKEDHLEGY